MLSLGPPGTILMATAIMISTFGCNNGLILAGARVYYAMARDGLFFKSAARLNSRNAPGDGASRAGTLDFVAHSAANDHTRIPPPARSAYGNVYTQLLEYIVSADLVFYILMVGAVIILRRKLPEAPRPYRTWGYPLVPLIYISIAGILIVDLIYLAPTTSGIGFLIVLTGVPVYFMRRRTLLRMPTTR